jgi:hypothetical protein
MIRNLPTAPAGRRAASSSCRPFRRHRRLRDSQGADADVEHLPEPRARGIVGVIQHAVQQRAGRGSGRPHGTPLRFPGAASEAPAPRGRGPAAAAGEKPPGSSPPHRPTSAKRSAAVRRRGRDQHLPRRRRRAPLSAGPSSPRSVAKTIANLSRSSYASTRSARRRPSGTTTSPTRTEAGSVLPPVELYYHSTLVANLPASSSRADSPTRPAWTRRKVVGTRP